jgi:dTDP-4-dehydrorhamnose reductase
VATVLVVAEGPVLVTGAAGLLGGWLLRTAPEPDSVVALTHRRPVEGFATVRADLRDAVRVSVAFEKAAPRLVVHAAYATDHESIVDATRNVVAAANSVDARVVFVSSDAVFAGDGHERDESSRPDAMWDYGRWKAAAEEIVRDDGVRGVVVRLPLLVSSDPDDHVVRQIRGAHAAGRPSRWYVDEMRRPVRASEVAAAIWRIVGLNDDERSGCWHLAGAERLSRYDIAARMIGRLGLPAASIEPASQPPDSTRPRDIAFSDARARTAIDWRPSPIG